VPEDVLYPAKAWSSKDEYTDKYRQLAGRFADNFKIFAEECPPEVREAGPVL
jgi:phosphoenolpyruvate carboxykinase (ATP)